MQIKSPPKIEGLKTGMWENLMTTNQHPFKSLFHRKKSSNEALSDSPHSPKPIPHLSPLANSVVFRCSKILKVSTEELQHRFDSEFPQNVKPSLNYARVFLEFCSFRAINLLSRGPDYLSDKEFCRLTYDVMLAWELPSAEIEPIQSENASRSNQEIEDEDGSSLFYSNSTTMAVQVDDKKTVGPEAFARIAPVCVAIADVLTVHNLFNSLTSASGYRLHFLIYDKYLRSLDKVMKTARNALGTSISNLHLAEGEIILDIDGAVPIQPVLQHIGISAWPGRLTLTNYALYFESLGVGLYDKAVRYDLAMDTKQVIKPELTGPLGARLFDKAVMYKSTSVAEPVYFEFPEFRGNSRRDYWLDICLEILRAHRFLRKNNLKETKRLEVLSRAILGVYRYRAVREAFHIFSSNYKTLLVFNLAESLPGGDMILETLSSRLALLNASSAQHDDAGTMYAKCQLTLSPVSLLMLGQLGFIIQKEANLDENAIIVGDVCVGETNALQMVVKQLISDTGRAEAAQATVDQVKVEGIDTNMAVMKELLLPVIELANSLQRLYSWEDPLKSAVFLVLACYAIYRDCIRYILSSISIFFAILMLWRRHFNRGKPLEAFRIAAPSNKNALGQLLTLQEAISHFESLIQAGNIILLKIRALLFAVLPQATDMVAVLLVCMAAAFAFVPLRYLMLLMFLEAFTRETRVRKESSDKWVRRIREWWIRIPAAPVQLTKAAEKKKMK